jgi:predicted nucleic-acid-binding protein
MDIYEEVILYIARNDNIFVEHNDVIGPFMVRYHRDVQFNIDFKEFIALSYMNYHWRSRADLLNRIVDYMRIHIHNAL